MSCLSGAEPIALSPNNTCNPGFYCPNNNATNPPEYCPPTPKCLITRMQDAHSICEESQSPYEPTVCSEGYYCPGEGKQRILCPSGHYCPVGSIEPRKCAPLSICPSGSSRELHIVGFFCCGILDIALLFLWIWPWLRRRFGSTRKDQKTDAAAVEAQYETELGKRASDGSIVAEDFEPSELASIFLGSETDVGLEVEFKDITLMNKEGGYRLFNISGKARKGSLFGVMGPSGSGKTTLVNILAGNLMRNSGSVHLNGFETGFSDLRHYRELIGYVPQDDIVHPHLTVRENILYSARIRLGGLMSDGDIQQHVDKVIQGLSLGRVMDSVVGHPGRRGVSGGERKRVSIGLELVASPRVLILDEPTSGLDARAALSTMMLLKSLSSQGITVITVIHQPRVEIFDALDDLLLLGSGKQVYFGEASEARKYFEALGYRFGVGLNPADMIMDTISDPEKPSVSPSGDDVNTESRLHRHWKDYQEKNTPQDIAGNPDTSARELIALHESHKQRTAPWHWQLYYVFSRDIKQQSRQFRTFAIEIIGGMITGLMIGLAVYEYRGHLFQGLYLRPFDVLSSAVNYIIVPQVAIFCSFAMSFAAAAPSVSIFAEETLVFQRESHSGHSESAYFGGKVLSSILRLFLSSLHFTTFYIILATPVASFGMILGLNLLYFYCIYGLGSVVAALTDRENGPLVCLLSTIVVDIFCGYAPRLEAVKGWHLEWFWYICPGTWFTEAVFNEHTAPFAYLYDIPAAAAVTGFTTGRTNFDIGILLVIGTIYRAVGCSLMVVRARTGWW